MSEQNFKQNKRFLRALPAGRISHFTSRIYPSLASSRLPFFKFYKIFYSEMGIHSEKFHTKFQMQDAVPHLTVDTFEELSSVIQIKFYGE